MKIDILRRKQVVLSLVKLFGIGETAVRVRLGVPARMANNM
jgi:ribosomal protein S13